MRTFRCDAIIIRRRNFLEKDRILTLFSKDLGKIEALAKGARRPGNRLSPNSDLATIAKFHIHKTKSIDIISEIEPIFHPFGARGKFDKTQKISFGLKIIDKLFELGEPHERTYEVLSRLIRSISDHEKQLIFLKFLIEVLSDLGYLPSFIGCSNCHRQISAKDDFVFNLKGGLAHTDCCRENFLDIGKDEVKLLKFLSDSKADDVVNYKVNKVVFEKTYNLIKQFFSFEFGKMLPDEIL